MPVLIILMGALFNIVIAYLNGRFIFEFSDRYVHSWLFDPRFIIGIILFVTGHVLNHQSDSILRALRKPNENDYKIPPGSVFALWTCANLAPRAKAYHRWYRDHFEDYPDNRKALIPGVW